MVKQNYKTEQRKELLEFMVKNNNKFVNADDIEKYLKNRNISIGLTTIYRFLNSLEKQGKVRVEYREHTKYYQYISEECNNHYSESSNRTTTSFTCPDCKSPMYKLLHLIARI